MSDRRNIHHVSVDFRKAGSGMHMQGDLIAIDTHRTLYDELSQAIYKAGVAKHGDAYDASRSFDHETGAFYLKELKLAEDDQIMFGKTGKTSGLSESSLADEVTRILEETGCRDELEVSVCLSDRGYGYNIVITEGRDVNPALNPEIVRKTVKPF